MSTTRVSLADLAAQPHEYSAEEISFRENATEEDLHKRALADPDAQPWTDEMFRRAQAARMARLAAASPAAPDLLLENADLSSDLPTWIVTDENGEIFHLQAANVSRATPGAATSAVRIVPSLAVGGRTGARPSRGDP